MVNQEMGRNWEGLKSLMGFVKRNGYGFQIKMEGIEGGWRRFLM